MKKMMSLSVLLFAVAMLVSCDKKASSDKEEGAQEENNLQIEYFGFQEEEDGPWGLMATDGTVLVKPKYYGSISPIVNDRFTVSKDGECTIYTGEEKPKKIGTYKSCASFSCDLCPVVDKNRNVLYIDKDGKTVINATKIDGRKVEAAFIFTCGRAMIKNEDNHWGFIDESGEAVIPIKYADAWFFNEDVAIVYLDTPTYGDDDPGKWCVIDKDGKKLFTKRFNEMSPTEFRYSEGLLAVRDSNGSYLFIDKEGNIVTKVKNNCGANNLAEGMFVSYNDNTSKYGLLDKDGEKVIPYKFETLSFNGKLLAGNIEEGENALYTLDGEKIVDLPNGYITLFDKEYKEYDSYLLIGSWNNGYMLIDAEGNKVDTKYTINDISISYTWGVFNEEEEDYYEEEDYE